MPRAYSRGYMSDRITTIQQLRDQIQLTTAMACISDNALVTEANVIIESFRRINTDLSIAIADMLQVELTKAIGQFAKVDRANDLKSLVMWAGQTKLGWL